MFWYWKRILLRIYCAFKVVSCIPSYINRLHKSTTQINYIINYIKQCSGFEKEFFSEIAALLRLYLASPAKSTVRLRSAWAMWNIKNWLHSAMTDDALTGLKHFLATESPLKMMKNAFYSPLKLFPFSRYLSFCLDFLIMYRNGLIKKIRLISNFMASHSC